MRRSGFMPEGLEVGAGLGQPGPLFKSGSNETLIDVTESPVKSPPPKEPFRRQSTTGGAGWSGKQHRQGRSIDEDKGGDGFHDHEQGMTSVSFFLFFKFNFYF